jgi:hypothetical protein
MANELTDPVDWKVSWDPQQMAVCWTKAVGIPPSAFQQGKLAPCFGGGGSPSPLPAESISSSARVPPKHTQSSARHFP